MKDESRKNLCAEILTKAMEPVNINPQSPNPHRERSNKFWLKYMLPGWYQNATQMTTIGTYSFNGETTLSDLEILKVLTYHRTLLMKIIAPTSDWGKW